MALPNLEEEYNEIKQLEKYSTEETKTSKTWIDGKPIYRRVCTGTPTEKNKWSVICSDFAPNIETLTKLEVYIKSGNNYLPPYNEGESLIESSIRNTNLCIYIKSDDDWVLSSTFVWIVEYTKTID